MHVVVIGGGYLGTTQAAHVVNPGRPRLPDAVTVVELDQERVQVLRDRDQFPFHEPRVASVWKGAVTRDVTHPQPGQIRVLSMTMASSMVFDANTMFVICVGTPPSKDGGLALDMNQVQSAVEWIAGLPWVQPGHRAHVVVRSTIMPKTLRDLQARHPSLILAHAPEFFQEGRALMDGAVDRHVLGILPGFYGDAVSLQLISQWCEISGIPRQRLLWLSEHMNGHLSLKSALDRLYTDVGLQVVSSATSAMIKLGTNFLLAARLTAMQELALASGGVGADLQDVIRGVTADARIGTSFAHPGAGWGGSCLPKDTQALSSVLNHDTYVPHLHTMADWIIESNEWAPVWLTVFWQEHMAPAAQGTHKVLWLGAAFKGGTGDLRWSPSIDALAGLGRTPVAADVSVTVHDPCTSPETLSRVLEAEMDGHAFSDLSVCPPTPEELANELDAHDVIVFATEHLVYLPMLLLTEGRGRLIIDMRRAFRRGEVRFLLQMGWRYTAFGADQIFRTRDEWDNHRLPGGAR